MASPVTRKALGGGQANPIEGLSTNPATDRPSRWVLALAMTSWYRRLARQPAVVPSGRYIVSLMRPVRNEVHGSQQEQSALA